MDLTPIPTGNDVQVNTTTTTGGQRFAAVAALAGGGFVVTWTAGVDSSGSGSIYGQRYAADGTALGGEFRVNTNTFNDQSFSSVTALAGGGFVVTWSSPDGSRNGTYGQRYAADGTALGSEFRVNTYPFNDQYLSSVTALVGGGFVVTWTSAGQDVDQEGYSEGIYGQRYAADGTAVGGVDPAIRVERGHEGDRPRDDAAGEQLVALLAGQAVQLQAVVARRLVAGRRRHHAGTRFITSAANQSIWSVSSAMEFAGIIREQQWFTPIDLR
jgi:hypothetical protein